VERLTQRLRLAPIGELLGRGGLSYKTLEGVERLEVGWLLRRPYWGAGYATELGRAGLDFAFGELGAAEVVAITAPSRG
jgi:ribosomal-protein-alanine N-acetyltransferase